MALKSRRRMAPARQRLIPINALRTESPPAAATRFLASPMATSSASPSRAFIVSERNASRGIGGCLTGTFALLSFPSTVPI